MKQRMNGLIHGWMGELTDRYVDGWMDEWMDG